MVKQKEKKALKPSGDKKKRGLGRGLSDLGLNELLRFDQTQHSASSSSKEKAELKQLSANRIKPGPYQPRRRMDEGALKELADSIRTQGIIQPIVVRRSENENEYEIIAGERRWRAAQLAGLTSVPVIIRAVPNEIAMAFALIENIQRENLNAIEEALALQRLLQECRMTHQAVAEALGKSRTSVTNTLRLLKLNPDVRTWVEERKLEMGHARALLTCEGPRQSEYARRVIERQLSVRETEALVQQQGQLSSQAAAMKPELDPDVSSLQRNLSDKLGASVWIRHDREGSGKLVIRYNSLEELEGILARIR